MMAPAARRFFSMVIGFTLGMVVAIVLASAAVSVLALVASVAL